MRIRKVSVTLAALALVLAACGAQQEASTPADGAVSDRDIRIVVVTHGQASDPFWSVVVNGVDQAEADLGIEVEYNAPETFDMVEMSQLIDTAVASEPDGIVISNPDPSGLGDAIQAAIAAGIPVLSINSGSDVFAELGLITHIGQTEFEAGVGAGERMAEAGVTNTLCINQEVGNAALDQRCEGFEDGLGGPVEVVSVPLADPTDAQNKIRTAVEQNPEVDGMLTLGPTGAEPALKALKASSALGDVTLATFDLSPSVLKAVRGGDMAFAVDQQQYLQGYLPIVYLTQYAENGTIPATETLTGPAFVTQENAERVIKLSEQGIR